MLDFATARRMMVDGQIRPNDVTDLRIISAFLSVPRERFVPAERAGIAYLDLDVPVTTGMPARCLLKPMVLAKFLQIAGVGEADRVLDVGTATGYSSAVLSYVAGSVVGLELDSTLAREATETVSDVASAPVEIVQGPLEAGWAARAPYDVIVINGAIEELPQALCDQLCDGGRLVCVLGTGPGSKAMLSRTDGLEMSGRPVFDAAAAALPGFAKVPSFAF
ncbi:MAG: protein-L-isoaspartate O-methyltransferase family protein [Pseudolabrys sp.]